jgi:hypothetical protein
VKDQPIFDHEKLDVYGAELLFVAWATALLNEIRPTFRAFTKSLSKDAVLDEVLKLVAVP